MTDFYVKRRNASPWHEGCNGFDFRDSNGRVTKYYPNSNGRIVVDNPEHAKVIEQAAHNDGGYIQKAAVGIKSSATESKRCPECRFLGYRWQTDCPKCGSPLELEGDAA